MALFCVPEQALRRVYHLPEGREDRLTWADQAYLGPLLMLMDEYECYGVALLDHKRARFFLYYLNEVAEYGIALRDELPPRQRDRRWDQLRHLHWWEEQYQQHFRRVANMLMHLEEHERWPRLALGGTEENTRALIKELPKSLLERVAGVFRAPVTANLVEVRNAVAGIERERL